ncbi:Bacterial type II secretion system protein F domain protein [Vibrio quintilis]|uniref:Bacterial type II secretion system protein F domain protein n=2 Tax=Vibrio quintilis TaxID=1117707 RepID=A0A1M7YV21_9VIBR|nr:Bacterial type II secretion system protein F domain protein [Vibrio quintilis]
MAWLSLIFGGILLLVLSRPSVRKKKTNRYLHENNSINVDSMEQSASAVNLNVLSDETLWQKTERVLRNLLRQMGRGAPVKVTLYIVFLVCLSVYINDNFLQISLPYVLVMVVVAGFWLLARWLQKREKAHFDEEFPDALNMLASSVSSGESLMHAIIFVGKSLEGEVGREFRIMGERLQIGETPDLVFRKACKRFPYPAFHFFVITLRANMQRGGQLREIITRLNRLMFEARAIEKKKYALTAEARTSAKIVGAIPFFFLIVLRYLSPENYQYVMFNPEGRYILYYVLISEAIGIGLVWKMMRGVES